MDLRGYISALCRNWLIVCLLALVGLGIGFAAYRLTPATYASKVTFYVASPVADGANPQSAGQFAEDRVGSYALLLQSDRLAGQVATGADIPMREVEGAVTASAEASTVLVTATVTTGSAETTQQVASQVADLFPAMVDELDNQGSSQTMVTVTVVSGPTLATQVAPSLKKYAIISLLAGVIVGAIIALARELFDVTVRSVETATALVKVPVIGTIDHDTTAKKEPLIVGSASSSTRAEGFRQLRANLRYIDTAEPTDVILVTSSLPVEGKSTVAADLALALVEAGSRVLLMDGDLRRPSVANLFGLEQSVGLTNVLVGHLSLESAIQTWSDKSLDVLTSGGLPPNPSELLGTPKMQQLMIELRGRYDKIIIDAPPLLPVADAVVASDLADGVLFVVRYGKTARASVINAARALRSVDARVIGTVLNMRRMTRRERKEYAGEGYARITDNGMNFVDGPPVISAERAEQRKVAPSSRDSATAARAASPVR